MYGGTGIPFGEASSNKLHVCNLNTLEWKTISTQGDLPIPGYGSVSILYVINMFVISMVCG